jgi:glycosyltransferase involved in cell wall biosynthesis
MRITTIIARNYLAHARVLAESFTSANPGGECSVLVIDDRDRELQGAGEPFELLRPDDVEIEEFERMAGIYDVTELSTAVKPALLRHLLQRDEVVTYLDPDIEVFSSLEEIASLAESHGVVLTPHTTSPVPADGHRPDQDFILSAGAYNLGFIAVARRPEVDGLLEWWRRRLLTDCLDDVGSNRFVDQRWMDLAPGFVSSLCVLRDPGYNVAYWNLFERTIENDDGRITVNGEPLRFFHFSGYSPERPDELSRHDDRTDLDKQPVLRGLCEGYRRKLDGHGYQDAREWEYGFSRLPGGMELNRGLRQRYRRAVATEEMTGSLFSEAGAWRFVELLSADHPWGVNLLGYLESEMGVGEAGRQMLSALSAADVPRTAISIPSISRQGHDFTGDGIGDARYPVNLICANADMMVELAAQLGSILHGRYSVGLWWWEVESFPRRFGAAFAYLDEIWVGSEHTRGAVAAASSIPVKKILIPVAPVEPSAADRDSLGLPGGFLFLFAFDYLSDFERKNPLGVVEAFSRAFEPGSGASLAIKSINADRDPRGRERLESATAGHPDVTVIDGYLDAADKNAMIAAADCFISLHRSEGFGLMLAEAMYFGVPTIATRYSGNLEFMTDENAYLVDCEIGAIEGSEIYSGRWAEPDTGGAAAIMREVFESPDSARDRGRRGAADIRQGHSPDAAGRIVDERLQELRPEASTRAAGLGENGSQTHLARAAVLAGPPKPRPKRGVLRDVARRVMLRLIRPYTAHQRRADLLTIDAIEELRTTVAELSSEIERLSERIDGAAPDRDPGSG